MRRIFAIALTFVMAIAALTGCMKSQNPSGKEGEENPSGKRLPIAMTIAETLPSCVAFEYKDGNPYCFYAYDSEGMLYRVLWTDFTELNEKNQIVVEYSDIKKLTYDEYPSGWTPQYEITATHVTLESNVLVSCLTYENSKYILTLPQSGKKIELSEEQTRFVLYITDELVEAAEIKITQDISEHNNNSGFYLQIDENYLCLVVEVIKYLDEPDEIGDDHEHFFYSERISSQAVTVESNSDNALGKSSVLYRSDEDEIYAFSSLLWSKYDNGDGTYTETQAAGIKGVLFAGEEEIPKLLSFQNDTIQPLVPVNGQVLGVYLLDMTNRANYPMTETTWEEIEMLPPGIYYIATQVLLSGNCDPDALQHSFCYEDLFCLMVAD